MASMGKAVYKRIVLKLSGEALAGDRGFGIDSDVLRDIAAQVEEVWKMGVEVAVVVGGGNIWRGAPAGERGMDRATADYMGMLATVLNALALQDALEARGVTLVCKLPLKCSRLQNHIFDGGRFAIWKRTV